MTNYVPTGGDLKPGLAVESARALATHYDSINGGIGQAPKFPNTFVFSLFLRVHAADGDESMAEMVRHTLSKMARGGIYDQIGGGFHRYSVDERWLVPHFEKMLYDNALLARLYLDAGRALNEPEFLRRRARDFRLRIARDDESRGRLLRGAGRGQRGRRGQVLRLDAREGRRRGRSGTRADRRALFRRHDRREFRGREHSASHDRAGRRGAGCSKTRKTRSASKIARFARNYLRRANTG